MPATSISPRLRGAAAREAILETARECFLSDGYAGTSIEAIARATGVSRPTVYAYFSGKQDIYRAIVASLHEEQLAGMRVAAAAPGDDLAALLYGVLLARFGPFVELTSSSPFGAELLDENSRICGDLSDASRVASLRVIERLLADAEARGQADLRARGLGRRAAAELIYDCALGLKEDPKTTLPAYRRRLRRLVGVLLGGLCADGSRKA